MAQAHAKPQHDYHLVNPSPWPIVGALGGSPSRLAFSCTSCRRRLGDPELWYVLPGLLLVIITMFGWWRDVIKEAHDGHETPVVQLHLRYGMILFIASEVMFFVAWFWAYFDVALFPDDLVTYARTKVLGGEWPPIPSDETGVAGLGYFGHTFNPWEPALRQHADPAHLGHDGDLGASRDAAQRPEGPRLGSRLHRRARPAVHQPAGL